MTSDGPTWIELVRWVTIATVFYNMGTGRLGKTGKAIGGGIVSLWSVVGPTALQPKSTTPTAKTRKAKP